MEDYIKMRCENAFFNEKELRPFRTREIMWAELRPIRDEICDCLMFGLPLAAVSLTNHFLERMMKLGLIYFHAGNPSLKSLESYAKKMMPAIEDWDSKNLCNNIEKAVKLTIISKELGSELKGIYDEVRNGFSHAQMSKIFTTGSVRLASFRFDNPFQAVEIHEAPLANVPIMHGEALKEWAIDIAPSYLVLVLDVLSNMEQNINRLVPRT